MKKELIQKVEIKTSQNMACSSTEKRNGVLLVR